MAITPVDAERLGIRTGDVVRISTPSGSAKAVAVLRHGVRAGVEHGFGHKEHGARAHRLGNKTQPTIPGIAAGINLNDLD